MTFWQSVETTFRNHADFSGRASRSEYFQSGRLFMLVWATTLVASAGLFGSRLRWLGGLLIVLVWLAVALGFSAVRVRRCHDTGRSGWTLYPFVAFAEGDPWPNKYGPPPDQGEATDEAPASWSAVPPPASTRPAVFAPCATCGRKVNTEIERCPYCLGPLGLSSERVRCDRSQR
ncbi:DUF805 domain-containing protein [bacterium]|nr:DUF805 domain-containing protein [bacterium]